MGLSVNIPFEGFYDSWWSSMLDDQANQFCEYEAEYREAENGIPSELRLDANEFAEILFDVTDYKQTHRHFAETYAQEFDAWASEKAGFELKLKFEEMTSPRFYNFETDRIFCTISLRTAQRLFAISKKEKHERLAAVIADRHTSRSGFISFYKNDLPSWVTKPIRDWDHNELGTLLRAICGDPSDSNDINELYESITDSGYHSFEASVNWSQFATKVAEARDLKAAEVRKDQPDYVPLYRCDKTLDLFAVRS